MSFRSIQYYLLAIVISLISSLSLMSQNEVIGLDLLDKRGTAEIPFELEQGFIIVKIRLGGVVPLRMIFDTGAENTILFDKEISQVLGIEFERQIPIMGSDLDSVLIANIARDVKMKLEGTRLVDRDIIVLEENNLLLKEKLGVDINGIIGGAYFPNVVLRIDYKKKLITLTSPKNFKKPNLKYHEYDLDIVGNKPYVKADITIRDSVKSEVTLLLDTGAALPFLIHANTDSTLMLPDKLMIGNVGFGLSGVIHGYMGRSRKLEMGGLFFNEIATSFQDLDFDSLSATIQIIRNGIIGNNLLSRFIVTIDYTKEKLYLRPIGKYNKEFDFDKSGLTIFAVGPKLDQYFVVAVLEDSPAARAGIYPGDYIKKVGCRKSKNMSLQSITNKFSRKAGKKVKLTIVRNEEEIKKEFILEDWSKSIIASSN